MRRRQRPVWGPGHESVRRQSVAVHPILHRLALIPLSCQSAAMAHRCLHHKAEDQGERPGYETGTQHQGAE